MKEKITAFLHTLGMYDYFLFGSALFLFLLFLILAMLLRHRFFLAIILLLLGFTLLMFTPTVGYVELHKYLYKNTLVLDSYKKLHFTQVVVINGSLHNISRFDFKECLIEVSAYKITKNKYKNFIYKLKPFQKISIVEKDIHKNEIRSFKILMEPFVYQKDFNISLGASCR